MWHVVLTKTPTQNDFRSNYFPRNIAYKKDANKLIEEVVRKGGTAEARRGKAPEVRP